MKGYKWYCKSSDGSYEDESRVFDTKKECYNRMRDEALSKMTWNTEYEDFDDLSDDDYIGYRVKFSKDYIEHTSYSGTYRYWIEEYNDDVERIKQFFFGRFGFIDGYEKLWDAMKEDIIKDVRECVGDDFTDADVDIAIGRVLKNMYSIE